jgi:hypothetical protein
LTVLTCKFPAPHERVLNIQNYLITVGGIISAFVIAYLSAKIFNIKSDRENRQIQIDKLAERLTAFRQLIFYVLKSSTFWIKYSDVAKFKREYPEMDYQRLKGTGEDKLRQKFWLEEEHISKGTISLYTAMEAIYDTDDIGLIPWTYDKAISFRYSLDDLSKYHEPCNQIWYYLDGRYSKYGLGLFNEEGLSVLYKENFNEVLPVADIRQKGKEFHRLVLANLGAEFYEFVIPKMAELIKQNTGIPKGLLKTFYSLIAMMTFGVILPITLQSLLVCNRIDTFLTLTFVNLTTLSLIHFLFEFYDLLQEELFTNKKSSH